MNIYGQKRSFNGWLIILYSANRDKIFWSSLGREYAGHQEYVSETTAWLT